MGRTRSAGLLTVLALAVSSLALPARAEPAPSPLSTVLLTLAQRPGDGHRLSVLARTPLARGDKDPAARQAAAERRAAVAALAPHPRHQSAVLAFARSHDLQVRRADQWTATLAGPATKLAVLFGTTLVSGRAANAPVVPPALARDVTAVSGLDDRPLLRAHAVPFGQTGPSLRLRYDAPSGWTGAGVTVGTLNLTGWDPKDLSTYAAAAGIELAPGQITTVRVGDPADPLVPDGSGDDLEVAMDAQAILAVAPAARQRQYFAPNNGVGTIDAFNQMAADGAAGLLHVASTSWGLCETKLAAYPWYITQVGQAVDRMLAAGVTLFAASGDSGAFDCSRPGSVDNRPAVDFPASHPAVVGVGGSRLGSTESAWGAAGLASPGTTFAGVGGGGGSSALFPRPTHQAGLSPAGTGRLVPDVASVADPSTGMGIYNRRAGGWLLGGGTSLGAPIWAGLVAAAMSSTGRTTGLGNVLPTLYDHPKAFRDITTGHNGYPAVSGYDRATGLGAPIWGALAPLLVGLPPDVAAPRATTSAALATGKNSTVRFRWAATDLAPSAGLAPFDLKVTRRGGGTVWSATTNLRTKDLSLSPGHTYTLSARARDMAGRVSTWATSTVTVPRDQSTLRRTGSWGTATASADYRGSHLWSKTRGSKATVRVTGRSVTVGVVRGRSSGYVDVWIDGKKVRRLDLYATKTAYRQPVTLATWTRSGSHTVMFVVVGARRAAATANTVRIDSLTIKP